MQIIAYSHRPRFHSKNACKASPCDCFNKVRENWWLYSEAPMISSNMLCCQIIKKKLYLLATNCDKFVVQARQREKLFVLCIHAKSKHHRDSMYPKSISTISSAMRCFSIPRDLPKFGHICWCVFFVFMAMRVRWTFASMEKDKSHQKDCGVNLRQDRARRNKNSNPPRGRLSMLPNWAAHINVYHCELISWARCLSLAKTSRKHSGRRRNFSSLMISSQLLLSRGTRPIRPEWREHIWIIALFMWVTRWADFFYCY